MRIHKAERRLRKITGTSHSITEKSWNSVLRPAAAFAKMIAVFTRLVQTEIITVFSNLELIILQICFIIEIEFLPGTKGKQIMIQTDYSSAPCIHKLEDLIALCMDDTKSN